MAIIIICRLLTCSLIIGWPKADAYEYFSIGSQLELAGNIEEAIVYYEKAKDLAPHSREICISLASAYYQFRDYQKGIMLMTQAMERFGPDPELYNTLAVGYIGRAEYDKAIKVYENALARDSSDILIYSSLSILYEAVQDPQKAREILLVMPEELLTTEVYTRLAAISGRMNKPDQAIDYYHQAYALDSANIAALAGLATAFDILKNPDSAVYYYEQTLINDDFFQSAGRRLVELYTELDRYDLLIPVAIRILDRNYYDTHMRRNLAFAYYKTGHGRKALSEFHIAARLDPHDTYSRFYAGRIYLEDGRHDAALAEIDQALKINPWFIELWIYRAFIALEKKDYSFALQSLNQAAYNGGDMVQIYYLMGAIAEMQENYYTAYRFYRNGLKLNPVNLPNLEALANLCARLERTKSAARFFSMIIDIDTTNASALNYVAYRYAEQAKNLELALALINRALSIEPANGFFIDTRGWVYYQMGEYDRALSDLLRAGEIERDAVILEHIGDAYDKIEEPGKARQYYHEALELDPKNRALKRKIKKLEK